MASEGGAGPSPVTEAQEPSDHTDHHSPGCQGHLDTVWKAEGRGQGPQSPKRRRWLAKLDSPQCCGGAPRDKDSPTPHEPSECQEVFLRLHPAVGAQPTYPSVRNGSQLRRSLDSPLVSPHPPAPDLSSPQSVSQGASLGRSQLGLLPPCPLAVRPWRLHPGTVQEFSHLAAGRENQERMFLLHSNERFQSFCLLPALLLFMRSRVPRQSLHRTGLHLFKC